MRYHPTTLGEARLIARTLDFETKYGDLGVNRCPVCHEATFAIERRNTAELTEHGYCLNPNCGYEPAEGLVRPEPFDRHVTGGKWL